MPELPEVETIRRRLLSCLPGLVISDVAVNDATVSRQSEEELRALLVDRRVLDLRRRGKYLLVDLEGSVAVIHLRMTGQLLFRPPTGGTRSSPESGSSGCIRRGGRAGALVSALGARPFGALRLASRASHRAALRGRAALRTPLGPSSGSRGRVLRRHGAGAVRPWVHDRLSHGHAARADGAAQVVPPRSTAPRGRWQHLRR